MKKLMNALEVFAKAMVQPLMYLSVAGMILAIGSLLTNTTVPVCCPSWPGVPSRWLAS